MGRKDSFVKKNKWQWILAAGFMAEKVTHRQSPALL